ncbi:MAG: dephospho-CoA kinase [Deltaproteobacteria bacterium]|nr:dephospho-CoA kinase [Deltaproteobacteria bacterium]
MKLIGLTGGIASGKSAVARMLRAAGVPVIDADLLAKEAVAPGTTTFGAVVARFGGGVLAPDGGLDRKALGALVFSDAAARADLNAIVHPAVAALAAERLDALRAQGAPLAVYEVPLLFESGLERVMGATLLVAAPEDLQVQRMATRDGLDEAAARARIAAQLPLEEKRKRATAVIDNDGTLEQLALRLGAAWRAATGEDRSFVAPQK